MVSKPRIFIGSSSEGIKIAAAIQELLEHDAEIIIWTQGIFTLSTNYLQSLEEALENFDFAILVYTPDDNAEIRGKSFVIPRDNVVFETGLFMGKLGRDKVFFVTPKSVNNFHLLSDLSGITYGTYDAERSDNNLLAALGPFCNKIRREIEKHVTNIPQLNKYKIIFDFESESPVRDKEYTCTCVRCNDDTGKQIEEKAELRWEAGVLTATIRGIEPTEMVQLKLKDSIDEKEWKSDYFFPIYSNRMLHINPNLK